MQQRCIDAITYVADCQEAEWLCRMANEDAVAKLTRFPYNIPRGEITYTAASIRGADWPSTGMMRHRTRLYFPFVGRLPGEPGSEAEGAD